MWASVLEEGMIRIWRTRALVYTLMAAARVEVFALDF